MVPTSMIYMLADTYFNSSSIVTLTVAVDSGNKIFTTLIVDRFFFFVNKFKDV